jgi:hypothetical protein
MHDVALALSRANFVDLNRTRENGAAKRCSLFGYPLCYLFLVLTRSKTHDHPATRARAATRPPKRMGTLFMHDVAVITLAAP